MMSQILFKHSISGVVLLDKPLGLTSNKALQKVKHLFGANKAGHTGSLDPLATGMLPICFGDATPFSQYLLDADKCYTVTACLGVKTTTGDKEGDVIASIPLPETITAKLSHILSQFTGDITQVPSMYSALKHEGKPLYKLARKGIEIERAARPITIHAIELLHVDLPYVSLRVICSKGTYIRNLIEDIGDALDVGAHVVALHREWVSGLKQYPMLTLDAFVKQSESPEVLKKQVYPFDILLTSIESEVALSYDEMIAMYQGKKLPVSSLTTAASSTTSLPANTPIRCYGPTKQCIGLGHIVDDRLQVLRLVAGHPSLM